MTMKKKASSLRSQFLKLYVLLAILSGIVVPALSTWLSIKAFGALIIQRRQEDINNLAEALTTLYNEEGGIWKRRRVMDILHPAPQWGNMRISLIDANEREIFTLRPLQQANHRGGHSEPEDNKLDKSEYEFTTLKLGSKPNIGRLEIARQLPPNIFSSSFMRYLTRYTLAGAVVMILIACGIGFFVAGKLSRPVINAIERTRKISKRNYEPEDISELSGVQELDELTQSVEDLGRSLSRQEELRRRLMIDIAHELRTPLTVTRTQIEAIADGVLEPTPERLNLCVNEMQRLGGLIANVEALSRLEGETLAIKKEKTDMKSFLEPVLETFRPIFEKSGINFSHELDGNIYCEIDRENFRHVIDNLLSNAQRYTDKNGNVNVKLHRENNSAIIEVQDTGIGISEKDLPNIFERFYRTDESRTRVTGGSGVGLAIVKAAVEAHGGKISAKSVKGEGSCFVITLQMLV